MNEIELEKILKALANRRRLLILKLIKSKKRATVSQISESIKLSFKSTSKHLAILYSAGFLEKEQISLNIYYSITKKLPKLVSDILNVS